MRYLLDTNVISEPFKRSPESRVIDWFNGQSPLDLHISVLTIGELTMGFELAPAGKRRDELQNWVTQDVPRHFVGRLLPVDEEVARESGAECPLMVARRVERFRRPTDSCSRLPEFTISFS